MVLAADAGGSKSLWVMLAEDGTIVGETKTEGLGAAKEGILPVRETVQKAKDALENCGTPDGIFLSLGGPNVAEVRQALEETWPGVSVTVEREACGNAVLEAAAYFGCSAVVMCGTGSTAVGDTQAGRRFAGGWGPMYGDGGSGGGMGSDALRRFLRSLDGAAEIGAVGALFAPLTEGLNVLEFSGRMEVKARALNMSRRELAALAPSIYSLAEQGDSVARELYAEAAEEIAALAYRVSDDVPEFSVMLCGGFLKNKPMLLAQCREAFARKSRAILKTDERFGPILAAELAALKQAGTEITPEILEKLLK